jgi:hypothetical protein
MNTSKISVETRRALVKPVTEFARAHNQPVSLIMAAVLWVGEKKPEQILSLVNGETLQTYREELARRAHARELQVKGMIKGALPSGERTPENVEEVAGHVFAVITAARKLSIPALKQVINTEVAALGKKAAA